MRELRFCQLFIYLSYYRIPPRLFLFPVGYSLQRRKPGKEGIKTEVICVFTVVSEVKRFDENDAIHGCIYWTSFSCCDRLVKKTAYQKEENQLSVERTLTELLESDQKVCCLVIRSILCEDDSVQRY